MTLATLCELDLSMAACRLTPYSDLSQQGSAPSTNANDAGMPLPVDGASSTVARADDDPSEKKKTMKRRKFNHACPYRRRRQMTCDEGRPRQRWQVLPSRLISSLT